MDRWTEYFKQLLEENENEISNNRASNNLWHRTTMLLTEEITEVELTNTIEKIKIGHDKMIKLMKHESGA